MKSAVFWELIKLQNVAVKFYLFLFLLILASALVLLGRLVIGASEQQPSSKLFPTGEANFAQAMYWSPQDTRDRFDLSDLYRASVLRTHLLGRGLFWLGHFGSSTFGLFGLYPLSLSKSAGFVSLLSWESFISFYIWCYLISTILACLFTLGVRISWKKLCRKGNMEGEFEQIITKIRLSIKTTTANCRVSFIDLYLVFPTNFRIVFLSLTNTAILLERWLWYYHKAWVTTVSCVQTIVVITVKNISWNFLTGNL